MKWIAFCALLLCAGPALAGRQARPAIDVRVVDVSGGMAYVEPGEAAGLRVGTRVAIGSARLAVVAVSKTGAALELAGARVAVGDRGSARVESRAAPVVERMPRPRPLADYRGQWRAARVPAASQSPRPVPLGASGATGLVRGALFAQGELVQPKGGDAFATGWLGARLSIDPLARPAGLDAEGALLLWAGDGLAGPDSVHRLGRVRELRLRWGSAGDPRVALGRLRWASMLAGPLDGVRVAAPVLGATVAGWGGFIPDEVSGRPATDSSSFGVELAYDRPERPLRPHAALSALGTTFDGALDERKLAAEAGVESDIARAGGHLELASFPGADPWNAPTLELAAAGADLGLTAGDAHATLSLGARRPERSRRLAALLPPEWLCTLEPRPPGEVEPCASAPLHGEASLTADWRGRALDLAGGVSAYHVTDGELGLEVTGFASAGLRDIAGIGRVQIDGDAGRIDFVDWVGGGGALGADLVRERLDVSARYHLTLLRYAASVEDGLEHRAGARAHLSLASTDLALDGELVRGGGADAVIALLSAVWRLP